MFITFTAASLLVTQACGTRMRRTAIFQGPSESRTPSPDHSRSTDDKRSSDTDQKVNGYQSPDDYLHESTDDFLDSQAEHKLKAFRAEIDGLGDWAPPNLLFDIRLLQCVHGVWTGRPDLAPKECTDSREEPQTFETSPVRVTIAKLASMVMDFQYQGVTLYCRRDELAASPKYASRLDKLLEMNSKVSSNGDELSERDCQHTEIILGTMVEATFLSKEYLDRFQGVFRAETSNLQANLRDFFDQQSKNPKYLAFLKKHEISPIAVKLAAIVSIRALLDAKLMYNPVEFDGLFKDELDHLIGEEKRRYDGYTPNPSLLVGEGKGWWVRYMHRELKQYFKDLVKTLLPVIDIQVCDFETSKQSKWRKRLTKYKK